MEAEIQHLIQIAKHRVLDSREQKTLLKYLKFLPESEAYETIRDMLDTKSNIPLGMVKSVLNHRDYVTKLLKYGLLKSNAQSIKLWLEFGIHKLGLKSVLALIEKLDNDNNQLIDIVLYWLPFFINKDSTKHNKLIDNLRMKVKKRESQSDL